MKKATRATLQRFAGLFCAGSLAALSAGCGFQHAGPMQHDSASVERDKSDPVHVTLNMGGGDLKVDSNASKLLNADFDFNIPAWKPNVSYNNSGGTGYLIINQGSQDGAKLTSGSQNKWAIHLNPDVPMEVETHMGGGDATLNLGGLTLRRVELQMGAGNLKMDLRGSPKASYDVKIRGGAGDATVNFPDGVGVDGTATGGIGDISATGFHNDGHHYQNDAMGKSNVTIHFDIEAGVGDLRLISGK